MTISDAQLTAARDKITAFLRDVAVDWYVVCGSGIAPALLGEVDTGDSPRSGLETLATLTFAQAGLPSAEVPGHGKALVLARFEGRTIAVQTGRLHPYEGHSVATCVASLAAALELGVGAVALTSAVGGAHERMRAGDLVTYSDQMNLFGPTPLVGSNFVDCGMLYDPQLRTDVHAAAREHAIALRDAVYGHARGPQYETPAEVAALARLGVDVIGMSTTYEAILAAAHATPCVGLGVVTNSAGQSGLSHEEVTQAALEARVSLRTLLLALLGTRRPHQRTS